MAAIIRANVTDMIPIVVAQMALGYLQNNLTIQKLTTKYHQYSAGEFAKYGETLQIPKRGALVVNDKAENSNFTVQNPSTSNVQLSLNKHKEVTFAIERRAWSEINQDVISGLVADAMLVLAEQVDKDIMSLYTAAGTSIGTGVAITEANIQAARKALTDNKAAAGMKRYGIVNTTQVNNLLAIDRLVTWQNNGQANNIAAAAVGSGDGSTDYNSRLGAVYNFDLYESQLVPVVTSQSKNLFFSEDAFAFASRPMHMIPAGTGVQSVAVMDDVSGVAYNMTYAYNALAGAMQVSVETIYGAVCVRPEHVVVVSCS